uniref:OSJNBa0043L24.24 protein n=1 Tax=Oryza sativa subsp. japonica TaxID=39947 RepID=Q7X6N1_ORYSJ|nr:OSJNBb0065L13.1 [Oryza sativa Japonica Group]CAE04736.1 OSJNBa0043L24.24 [Oryza sativa Japonica Group]
MGLSLPKKGNMLFTMRASLQPEVTSDKQSTRLLPCSPAFPVDAPFNLHLMASDFIAILALKSGMDLTGTNIPTPGVSTPAPARDESQETLIIPTGRGEACDRPPVAT